MVVETKPKLTLREKVDILREHGVDVWDWKDPKFPGEYMFFPLPTVFFDGDENEGHRAAVIMREHGVHVWQVQKHWYYDGEEEPHRTHWTMVPLGP